MSRVRNLCMCLRPVGLDPFYQRRFSDLLKLLCFVGIGYMISPHISNLTANFNGLVSLKRAQNVPSMIELAVKAIVFCVKMQTLRDVDEIIGGFWPLDKFGKEIEQQLKSTQDSVFLLAKSYFATCFLSAVVLDLVPLITNSELSPSTGYNFCDLNRISCFTLQILLHSYTTLIVCLPVYVVFDAIFVFCVAHACCSFKMIKCGYRDLNRKLKSGQLKTLLRDLVDQHGLVLSFIQKMESLYSIILVMAVLGITAQITLNLYVLTSQGIPPPLHIIIQAGSTLLTINLHLVIYCFGGELIIEEMESVTNVVYEVEWWEVEESEATFGKDLRYIMERSQRSEPLTVGKILRLNLDTFILIQKVAFQIYTLITNLEKED